MLFRYTTSDYQEHASSRLEAILLAHVGYGENLIARGVLRPSTLLDDHSVSMIRTCLSLTMFDVPIKEIGVDGIKCR